MSGYRKGLRALSSMLVSSILALVVGIWIDQWLHITPWIMLILLAYAIIGNLYILVKGTANDE